MESSISQQAGDDFSLAPLRLVSPTTLQGKSVPDREWIWDGWIPMHATTAFYGDGGTGKSLVAQQLMTSCATGSLFLGCDVRECKVLGVFCEDDEDELHRRQSRINAKLNIDFDDLANMQWISRVGDENLLMTFSGEGRGTPTPFYFQIMAAAKELGAQLIVIDTAADTFGGNENIRPQVRQFISMLNRLAMEIDGAVLLLAHPSQTGKTTGAGDGGSTAWSNSVRSRLYLFKESGEDGNPIDPDARTLSRLKANYARIGEKLSLCWKDGAFESDGPITQAYDEGSNLDRIDTVNRAFLAGLAELAEKNFRCNMHKGQANFGPKIIRDKTNAGVGFDISELEAAMNRLIREGRISSVEEGPPSRRRSFIKEVSPDIPGI
ncbi:MAG: AAA family ATPase [Planctomycetaceae bacterium]|nr:AAA family ATPase [Planctomycetaceae bacterium]